MRAQSHNSKPTMADNAPSDEVRVLYQFTRRHWRCLTRSALVWAVLALCGSFVFTPQYQSSALVLVDSAAQRLLDPTSSSLAQEQNAQAVANAVELLRSDAIKARALIATGYGHADIAGRPIVFQNALGSLAQAAPLHNPGNTSDPRLIHALSDRLRIEQRTQASTIAITVRNGSAERAAMLANAMAQAFLDAQIEIKTQALQTAVRTLDARLEAASNALRAIEAGVDRALLSAATVSLQARGDIMAAQTRQFADGFHALVAERTSLVTRPEAADRLVEIDRALAIARNQLQGFIDTQAISRDEYARLEALTDEAAAIRQSQRAMLDALKHAQFALDTQVADAQIVSPATNPIEPSFPNRPLLTFIGLVFGLAVGTGQSLARDVRKNRLGTLGDLERETGLVVATVLPDRARSAPRNPIDYMLDDVDQAVRASLRRLEVSVDALIDTNTAPVILIASPRADTSKDRSPSAALALAYAGLCASSSQRTILIDADFQRAAVMRELEWVDQGRQSQLSDVLCDKPFNKHTAVNPISGANQGDQLLRAYALQESRTGLTLLANTSPHHGTDDALVSTLAFQRMVEQSVLAFDRIVIHCAPVLESLDARTLAKPAHAVVLTLQPDQTNRDDVGHAMRALDGANTPPILGAITP